MLVPEVVEFRFVWPFDICPNLTIGETRPVAIHPRPMSHFLFSRLPSFPPSFLPSFNTVNNAVLERGGTDEEETKKANDKGVVPHHTPQQHYMIHRRLSSWPAGSSSLSVRSSPWLIVLTGTYWLQVLSTPRQSEARQTHRSARHVHDL